MTYATYAQWIAQQVVSNQYQVEEDVGRTNSKFATYKLNRKFRVPGRKHTGTGVCSWVRGLHLPHTIGVNRRRGVSASPESVVSAGASPGRGGDNKSSVRVSWVASGTAPSRAPEPGGLTVVDPEDVPSRGGLLEPRRDGYSLGLVAQRPQPDWDRLGPRHRRLRRTG